MKHSKLSYLNKVVICIPIYKSIPNENELISFNRVVKVLSKYQISIVTYRNLNIEFYLEILSENEIHYGVQFFNNKNFKSIIGYNRLLISREFYKRFDKFEYILVYQLDAYVFRDELLEWCNMGYSYIGAPWVVEDAEIEDWQVGNGGLSLRKTSDHIKVLQSFSLIKGLIPLIKTVVKSDSSILKKTILFLLIPFEYIFCNNTFFLLNRFRNNEDYFWSVISNKNFEWFKVPDAKIAMRFSFETSPSLLYNIINQFPFGCHAWEKREPIFWSEKFKECD